MTERRKSILLLGAGGHCESIVDTVRRMGGYERVGVVSERGGNVLGAPAVGCDRDLPALRAAGYTHGFVAVGSAGCTAVRRRLAGMLEALGFILPNIVDPAALVSARAVLGHGIFVGKRAVVNAGARVGSHAILNTACVVEHGGDIGAFAHIAPGAVLCGGVLVGADAHIGAGSTVIQGMKIGAGALVGAGSVVVRDIAAHKKAYGNPCRVRGDTDYEN